MIRRPPRSTRTDTLFPYTTLFRSPGTGLVRVRSPLLTESRLMSFPPGTEMFQFSGFASPKPILFSLVIPSPFNSDPDRSGAKLNGEGGLSHSEIVGSKLAHSSPTLIAARSEEHTSELQSQIRISYAVFCLKKKKKKKIYKSTKNKTTIITTIQAQQ